MAVDADDGVDAGAIVASVARDIDLRLPALTTEMTDWFVQVIPEFRHDDTARRLMIASTAANLAAIVDMLAHSIPIERVTVPAAAAEYARRFAQHDLPLEALLRAYRLGEQMFEQWALAALRARPHRNASVVLDAVSLLSERANSYIDQVIESLIDIYETEKRRWSTRAGAGLATRVRMVLETDPLSDEAAGELLGIPVTGVHRAAVLWVPGPPGAAGTADDEDDDATLQAGARLLREASDRTPLTVMADGRTLWAWLSGPRTPVLDHDVLHGRLPAGLRIAVGGTGTGLAGFRGSLTEAVRARAVAETAERQPPVTLFDEVAVAALLTDRSEDLRRWIDRVLGGLASDEPGCEQLRDTLRVFLSAGGSYTHAASVLHLHKNTVHYRVRKAAELRGRPVDEDRLQVEVALAARSLLRGRL
ncbi:MULTISPECIES: PucR family transcriptional regulator [Pseudonocardia]|nr:MULTISPECIES: helix-turn-helix domain-containing protein [Pseudonocardia]